LEQVSDSTARHSLYRLREIQAQMDTVMSEAIIADGKPCPVCFQGTLRRRVRRIAMDYKGRLFEQEQPGDWCDVCGEGILNGEDLQATEPAWLAFRDAVDREEGQALARIRRKLKLTQAEAAKLTGGGKNAFSRYERGEVRPLPAVLNLFKLLDKHPELLDDLRGLDETPCGRV